MAVNFDHCIALHWFLIRQLKYQSSMIDRHGDQSQAERRCQMYHWGTHGSQSCICHQIHHVVQRQCQALRSVMAWFRETQYWTSPQKPLSASQWINKSNNKFCDRKVERYPISVTLSKRNTQLVVSIWICDHNRTYPPNPIGHMYISQGFRLIFLDHIHS